MSLGSICLATTRRSLAAARLWLSQSMFWGEELKIASASSPWRVGMELRMAGPRRMSFVDGGDLGRAEPSLSGVERRWACGRRARPIHNRVLYLPTRL